MGRVSAPDRILAGIRIVRVCRGKSPKECKTTPSSATKLNHVKILFLLKIRFSDELQIISNSMQHISNPPALPNVR